MKAISLNSRVVPSQNFETHRTRTILNRTWDMQILNANGNGYQATYFDGADPKIWSECVASAELAAYQLDKMVDVLFGFKDQYYVRIGNRVPVPIEGKENAARFAKAYRGAIV